LVRYRDYFTIFVIIFMTGINFSPNAPRSFESIDMVAGNITTQIIKSAIYLIAFSILLLRWRYAFKLSAKNILIWFTLLLVFASSIWSEEPSLTLRASAGLFGTTVIALFLASFYDYERFAQIAAWSFMIINILSLLVIAFFPAYGISWDPNGWRGIYFTKNGLGINSLIGIIIFTALLSNKRSSTFGAIGLLMSSITLIGSKSVTSLVIAVFALSIWIVMLAFLNRNKLVFFSLLFSFLILFVIGIWIYLTNNTEVVFNTFGKDLTFTGRTPIWEAVLFFARQRPWLGYGYGAVWVGRDFGIGSYISAAMNYYVVNAHNGYLDMLLEIGIIGVILVLVVIITILLKLLANIDKSTRVKGSGLWPVVFLIAIIVYNSTEAMLLVQNNIAWIVIAYLGFVSPEIKIPNTLPLQHVSIQKSVAGALPTNQFRFKNQRTF
jgi:exopolysaccharide production protein ExoQ